MSGGEMVSRRKILSRSRDDLNTEQPAMQEEESSSAEAWGRWKPRTEDAIPRPGKGSKRPRGVGEEPSQARWGRAALFIQLVFWALIV